MKGMKFLAYIELQVKEQTIFPFMASLKSLYQLEYFFSTINTEIWCPNSVHKRSK